jgi:hypothetical protein
MMNISVITAPIALTDPIDIDRLTKTVEYYSNGRFSSVFFKHGTCVFPPLGGAKTEEAKNCLKNIHENQPFEVREMDDGNFIVKFTDEVFSVVFRDEFYHRKNDIIREVSRSKSTENILGKRNTSEDHIYIGIFARTRLIKDVHSLNVASELVPKII